MKEKPATVFVVDDDDGLREGQTFNIASDVSVPTADLIASATYGGAASHAVDGDANTAWTPTAACSPDCSPGLALEIGWAGPRVIVGTNLAWSNAAGRATAVDALAWSGRDWVKVAELRNAPGTGASLPAAKSVLVSGSSAADPLFTSAPFCHS